MCFSAGASFGGAALLAAIGVASIRSAPSPRHLAFAAIPLLFAAQQACEGALWLVLDHAPFGKSDTAIARAFLFFALLVWPAYTPASLFAIEPARARRKVLAALAAGGATLGLYLMGCASLRRSDACIAYRNLYYWVQIDASFKRAVPFLYLACIALPLVVSSLRGTSRLALLVIATFGLTGWVYRAGFLSVWCFEAALLSGLVAIVVRDRPLLFGP